MGNLHLLPTALLTENAVDPRSIDGAITAIDMEDPLKRPDLLHPCAKLHEKMFA